MAIREDVVRTQRGVDIWAGLFLSGVGVVVLIAGMQIQTAIGERLPPATLPLALGGLLTLGGLLLAVRSWRSTEDGGAVEWPDRSGAWRVAWSFLGLVAYLALTEPLGMAVSSAFFSFGLIFYLDRRWLRSLIIAVITGLIVHYVFIELLELTLPQGFWTKD